MRNNAIAKNTLVLYGRQIVMLFVNLYSVRLVLNALGVEDYGIYSVVGGVVALCMFLPGTMASATQRFFSFALGQNDHEKLKKTFTVNWLLYVAIGLLAAVILESVGLWFVNEHLRVPAERFEAAQSLYHLSVLTFITAIFASPFIAIIIAHEDMQIYAYVSICEALMKLCVVLVLMHLPWDKLELYGLLLLVVSLINTVVYILICVRKYGECQFRRIHWDRELLQEILGFTGWTLFGQMTTVARNQGVTILLNQMFNPGVVAARAIAITVTSQVNMFSNNLNTGLYPPIIKLYAEDNKQEMFSLIFAGSKFTFFLMWIFALPMLLEMDTVLKVWLHNPPPEAALFTRLALIEVLIVSLSLPIVTAARAPGRMQSYELALGSIQIAILFVSWIVLKMGGGAQSVFWVAIAANVMMFIVRLLIVGRLVGLPLVPFFKKVAFPVGGVATLSALPSYAIHLLLPSTLAFAAITVLLCMLIACVTMYFVGLDKTWREKMRAIVANRLRKLGALS